MHSNTAPQVETVVVDCVAPAGGLGGDPDPCPRSTGKVETVSSDQY